MDSSTAQISSSDSISTRFNVDCVTEAGFQTNTQDVPGSKTGICFIFAEQLEHIMDSKELQLIIFNKQYIPLYCSEYLKSPSEPHKVY